MLRAVLLFSILLAVCAAQKLIDLKSFRGRSVQNAIDTQAQYAIYVSATSDSQQLLDNIFVVTDDGASISLYKLKNKKLLQTSGQLQPYVVTKSAYVTTSLTDDQMNTLSGFMFVSSAKQLTNNMFYVIDVDKSQTVNLQGLGAVDSTVLFMNSNIRTAPYHSSVISAWKQDGSALASIYRGVPSDTDEPKDSQIFSNPMHTQTFDRFFPTVEKFSLSLGAFYLKTYKGVSFVIEPGYFDVDRGTTSSYTTTGFFMKAVNQLDRTVTIKTMRDTRYNGSTGANTIGDLPSGGKVSVGAYDGATGYSISFPPSDSIFFWQTPNIGLTFQGSSTNGQAGEYFVQYFVVQGTLYSATTLGPVPTLPGRQTTAHSGHVETTTRRPRKGETRKGETARRPRHGETRKGETETEPRHGETRKGETARRPRHGETRLDETETEPRKGETEMIMERDETETRKNRDDTRARHRDFSHFCETSLDETTHYLLLYFGVL
ncbi:unnamed protein product [Caenorhabditis sp. 36 PRJEB53466]|nr:unnamed protein product [Caenorhabditis sp. 36 PRJEB53466]